MGRHTTGVFYHPKALGEAGALAVNARAVPLVRSSTTRIVMVRADLTYSTAGPPAN